MVWGEKKKGNALGCLWFLRNDELIVLQATARPPSMCCELYLHWPGCIVSLLQITRHGASWTFPRVGRGIWMKISVNDSKLASLLTQVWIQLKYKEDAPLGVILCAARLWSVPVTENMNFGGKHLAVPFQGWLSTWLTQDVSKRRWQNDLTNH